MPLQLLSRPTDTIRTRSPSPFETPATKPDIPTIRLIAATPSSANSSIAPWSEPQPALALAPKASSSDATPRRRLVPKKSKLGLLSSRETDLSDVVRRVGARDSNKNGSTGIEIYVDPMLDPEIGEIVVVKKKKSRMALDGMRWGPALGEVTNIPHVKEKEKKEKKKDKENNVSKVKVDEKSGWWTIGKGKKDSKEKERSRSPAPPSIIEPTESRARFNSLDSGILLHSPVLPEHSKSPAENRHLRVPTPPSATVASAAYGATLAPPSAAPLGSGKDSVALRAMRSVRSLARIGSWAQLKNIPAPDDTPKPTPPVISEPKKKKKKKDKGQNKEKEKEKRKEKEKAATVRYSGSSFEAGALSASPDKNAGRATLGKKKSILGLGLPSTMRLPSMRSGSTSSSIVAAQMQSSNKPSADSPATLGCGILARARTGSTMTASSAGSVRPVSVSSGGSSGGCSVRWDEAGLETVKEIRRKERASKEKDSIKEKKTKGTRKSSDSRKRTPLSAVFPERLSDHEEAERTNDEEATVLPLVTIEEATVDGHSDLETPIKRERLRPLSEQLLGRSRPKAMYEDENDCAVLSLLDAATNDLAQLINRLDLQATPDMSPMSGHSPSLLASPQAGSPTKRMTLESPVKCLRASAPSITSLRPYAKTISTAAVPSIGQHIAPWATLNAGISPAKSPPKDSHAPASTFRFTHKRTMSPAPAAEPEPVFKALRPAKNRVPVSGRTVFAAPMNLPFMGNADRSPSSRTFGSAHSKSSSRASMGASPVFKKARGHERKPSSLVPMEHAHLQLRCDTTDDIQNPLDSPRLLILPDARRNLGLAGTLGGSVGGQELDASDPDSDIPDELQIILSNSDNEADDTLSFHPNLMITHPPLPSPGLPPEMPLPLPRGSVTEAPVFHAKVIDEDNHHADAEEAGMSSEDDTKKSFDFTGELQKLNECGGSDRLSFVEQLENAFRTPAKIDLRYDFDLPLDAPPVPKIPSLQAELERAGDSTFSVDYVSQEFLPQGFPMDVDTEPSLLPGTDSFATTNDWENEEENFLCTEQPQVLRNTMSMKSMKSTKSRPSNGQLNRNFKFGGKPSPAPSTEKNEEPLTLSDIIPPLTVAKSLSATSLAGDDSAVLKSIFAKAVEIPSPPSRVRLDSDSSSKRIERSAARPSNVPGHHRHSSELSFVGFDSFAEVRRGFEFHDNRPNFYPPPGATSRNQHNKRESMFSIASVSSYGQVINHGSTDPFDYGALPLPSLRERPSSDEFSFTMSSLDDTFSFIRKQPRRRRVDSDTSSFYFRASVHSQLHPYNRIAAHRRHSSSASVSSLGPPISLYNRNSYGHNRNSYGYRRRNDSNASMNSVSQPYTHGGRASWARHRPDFSVDSMLSDFSGINLGRPGLGDKMLDSALDRGMPLTAISASPPESPVGSIGSEQFRSGQYVNRMSYDSIMSMDHEPQPMEDSLFEKTGHRTSVSSSDSAFFAVDSSHAPPQFKRLSSYSIASVHSPQKEDDTMISMLGGGHVRRRSVGSMIEASPCRQVEKRKHIASDVPQPNTRYKVNDYESPKGRVLETKPSIASTAYSVKFGDERMIRAKHGLLERQSLENTVLIAEGEEDLSKSFRIPVFTRPPCAGRSRSSTCTSMSSGADTPPLSMSDGYSSFSDGSQSSIDLSHVNYMLSNLRPRARGHGHQRRISQARASRTSIYETIEEELTTSLAPTSSLQPPPSSSTQNAQLPNSTTNTINRAPVFVPEPETASVDSVSLWDDERGIMALRKYYALRDEVEDTVTESQRVWLDTPFSVFAVQSFDPPSHPSGMQALLEHSMQNYGPLPSELRPRRMRSRVNSRPSPYPRTFKTSFTSSPATEQVRAAIVAAVAEHAPNDNMRTQGQPKALQQISVNPNIMSPAVDNTKAGELMKDAAMSPGKLERVFGLPPRPRVGSVARRAALGWVKRSTGRNGLENKENASVGNISLGAVPGNMSHGLGMTPSETLRLNRPRPRGRPTPASARPIRI
ncbi:uncharacterized protein EDB93DRAFT_1173064 [Suillus bovinus]|uniref:uncharacterized protein n=1 Tax=Suillus bovinus TaxID=48563 RepID=UPI001B87F256|nr:uncharacterized protein EDB93DRAFT_1173064 [Suillus bovinus]KAG2134191.1 hypothetical protein EDB93DRAFT_1173064 [Suillus bovinus]